MISVHSILTFLQKTFYLIKFPPVSGDPSSWWWWAVLRQGGYAGTKLPPPPAPVHTRPLPRPVTTETRDSFSEVLCTQHATINDKGTLVLDGLPIILLGKILAFWSSRTLQNINFVVMWVECSIVHYTWKDSWVARILLLPLLNFFIANIAAALHQCSQHSSTY